MKAPFPDYFKPVLVLLDIVYYRQLRKEINL